MKAYHFLPHEFGISNIALSRIKISRYEDLNDPFELIAVDLSDPGLRKAFYGLKKDFHNTKGIICFSKSWENPVLWSHYADKHRGMALGLEFPDKYARPVVYNKNRVLVDYKIESPDRRFDLKMMSKILSTKFKPWDYEKEVRMDISLDEGTEEGGLYFMPFSPELELKEVVLGYSCPVPIKQIRELLNTLHPKAIAIKAGLAPDSFRVVPSD